LGWLGLAGALQLQLHSTPGPAADPPTTQPLQHTPTAPAPWVVLLHQRRDVEAPVEDDAPRLVLREGDLVAGGLVELRVAHPLHRRRVGELLLAQRGLELDEGADLRGGCGGGAGFEVGGRGGGGKQNWEPWALSKRWSCRLGRARLTTSHVPSIASGKKRSGGPPPIASQAESTAPPSLLAEDGAGAMSSAAAPAPDAVSNVRLLLLAGVVVLTSWWWWCAVGSSAAAFGVVPLVAPTLLLLPPTLYRLRRQRSPPPRPTQRSLELQRRDCIRVLIKSCVRGCSTAVCAAFCLVDLTICFELII